MNTTKNNRWQVQIRHCLNVRFLFSSELTKYMCFTNEIGIMFPVECINKLPIQFVEIQSISVRGELGMISVYTCDYNPASRDPLCRIRRDKWETRFGPTECASSETRFTELVFPVPLRLAPSQVAGIYIHSQLPSDTAIVYDNQRTNNVTYKDDILGIHPGIAHTSNVP